MDRVIDEVSIVDYEVTVGYTKDEQNRTVTLGKLADNYESKLLGNLDSESRWRIGKAGFRRMRQPIQSKRG